jgi:hypothetical protein
MRFSPDTELPLVAVVHNDNCEYQVVPEDLKIVMYGKFRLLPFQHLSD